MSRKRKINITISIEDSDFVESNLISELKALLGTSLIDYTKFIDTEHLKDDPSFRKLLKSKRDAGLQLDRYINENQV